MFLYFETTAEIPNGIFWLVKGKAIYDVKTLSKQRSMNKDITHK